jgi:hypothetical protein
LSASKKSPDAAPFSPAIDTSFLRQLIPRSAKTAVRQNAMRLLRKKFKTIKAESSRKF